jgi:putative flippase GtrA
MLQSLFQRHGTFLRYVVVGLSGTAIDLVSLYFMTEWSGIDPRVDPRFSLLVTIAFLLAVVNNYVLNRAWTFQSKDRNVTGEFGRFLVVALGGFLLTQMLMGLFVGFLGLWYMLSKALTSGLVLIWNFALNKLWTFRSQPLAHPELNHPAQDVPRAPSASSEQPIQANLYAREYV